ncbi:hypothetical protein HanHA89_Chr01g0029891 [Helianthus annuus]|nr:hypothetical protein HanHA89_Chr01g0029891 [Helianthus annuus]
MLCITSFSIKDSNVRSLHILCVYDVCYVSKIVSCLVWLFCFSYDRWIMLCMMRNKLWGKCKLLIYMASVVDMKQVVADEFVDGHLHEFTYCSNENVMADNMFVDHHFQTLSKISDEIGNVCNNSCQIFYHVVAVADNIFVDDNFQKLSKISDETGNVRNNSFKIFEELFGVLPSLTMSSIGAAKVNRLC